MGYRLNRLDEPVFMAVPKPLQTEFGIHYRLESCVTATLDGPKVPRQHMLITTVKTIPKKASHLKKSNVLKSYSCCKLSTT